MSNLTRSSQLRALCDNAALRKEIESALYPLSDKRGAKGGGVASSVSGTAKQM